MRVHLGDKRLSGVWSAAPTPLTHSLGIDVPSVRRMVERHLKLGVKGLFVAGTCGEGAWLTRGQYQQLIKEVAESAAGRLLIAAQVTDNSTARILENIAVAKNAGADIAVIAPPYFLLNATPANIAGLYREAIRKSPLPVGLYDRGRYSSVYIPDPVLSGLLLEKNVVMLKDSSAEPHRRGLALAARRRRPGLSLLNGDEFNCAAYLQAGYDGLLLGGAILTGFCAGQMLQAAHTGRYAELAALQRRASRLLYDVYGGKKITCWLAGLKHALVQMKVFSTNRNILNYPLTAACQRAIGKALKRDASLLFPGRV